MPFHCIISQDSMHPCTLNRKFNLNSTFANTSKQHSQYRRLIWQVFAAVKHHEMACHKMPHHWAPQGIANQRSVKTNHRNPEGEDTSQHLEIQVWCIACVQRHAETCVLHAADVCLSLCVFIHVSICRIAISSVCHYGCLMYVCLFCVGGNVFIA